MEFILSFNSKLQYCALGCTILKRSILHFVSAVALVSNGAVCGSAGRVPNLSFNVLPSHFGQRSSIDGEVSGSLPEDACGVIT